ncbi:MAG: hypothetical protein IH587_08395 [Anaerolineae bacterium]|nr:hypothetical protein [Anaerolineae bacterium]
MHQLNQLLQVVNAASSVAEIVREKQIYRYGVRGVTSLYLHVEGAEVRVFRWALPTIEVATQLKLGFGWRMASEQDDIGVYFVAKRRRLVGGLAGGVFSVTVPHATHVTLRLERCSLWMPDISTILDLEPDLQAQVALLPPKT